LRVLRKKCYTVIKHKRRKRTAGTKGCSRHDKGTVTNPHFKKAGKKRTHSTTPLTLRVLFPFSPSSSSCSCVTWGLLIQTISCRPVATFSPFVRSWFVTLRPLRGPANTMRAQGPKPCPSNET
jgi:hypothetical protein